MASKYLTCLLALAFTAPAFAADETDIDALSLADAAPAPEKPVAATGLKAFVELSVGQVALRPQGTTPATTADTQRLSVDLLWDKKITPQLRGVFSDRLDLSRQGGAAGGNDTVNTLKEAYLSWQPQSDRIVDLGRINARYGVAQGYNPTDFFRERANRSFVSVDPNSIRENRLGTVMLRGQTLWSGGSLTALVAPKLADAPDAGDWSLDLGSTNNRTRWMVSASHQLAEGFNPQLMLFGDARQSAQLGLNLAALLNAGTVAHVEWSGGRMPTLAAEALGAAQDEGIRHRLATGFTYTSASKVSLTAEYHYNGAALDQTGWNTLRAGSPLAYGRYRMELQNRQDLTTRNAAYLRAAWQDAFIHKLDLTAMLQLNLDDHSRLNWLEARYHWDRAELALQWQLNSGNASSDYGVLAQRRSVQAQLRYYFD